MQTCQIITIGDELLIGQVVDTNSVWLGQQLTKLGISVVEKKAVSDEKSAILNALTTDQARFDMIILTGGLGPTKDDITKSTLAEFFDVPMEYRPEAFAQLKEFLAGFQREVTELHKEQCYFPANAMLLQNKKGTAPGLLFKSQGRTVLSLPGVPWEMQYLFETHFIPYLCGKVTDTVIRHQVIMTAGLGETEIATKISDIEDSLPKNIKIAYLPALTQVRLRITVISKNTAELEHEIANITSEIQRRLGQAIYALHESSLPEIIGEILVQKGLLIALAESCTGGLISHLLSWK